MISMNQACTKQELRDMIDKLYKNSKIGNVIKDRWDYLLKD